MQGCFSFDETGEGKKEKKRIFKVTLLFEALFFPRRFLAKQEREKARRIINRREKEREKKESKITREGRRGGVNKKMLHRFVERHE